jgi:hypothetical protein
MVAPWSNRANMVAVGSNDGPPTSIAKVSRRTDGNAGTVDYLYPKVLIL